MSSLKEYSKIHPNSKFNLDYVDIVSKLKSVGLADKDVGYILGVSKLTINRWKKQFPEFKDAWGEGKETAKSCLVARAFQAAAGFDYIEKNVKVKTKVLADGTEVEYPAETSEFHKVQPPNPQLLMFLLCNLDPENWKSKHKLEIEDNKTINIRLDGKIVSEQIERLAGKLANTKVVESHEVIENN